VQIHLQETAGGALIFYQFRDIFPHRAQGIFSGLS
jgi:hypothetical protein